MEVNTEDDSSYNYDDNDDDDDTTGEVIENTSDVIESKSPRRFLPSEELGPVTARFVIVRRGMDVVLECHDAVGGDEVMWEKQGGEQPYHCPLRSSITLHFIIVFLVKKAF